MKRIIIFLFLFTLNGQVFGAESKMENSNDERMAWWREARFGMFIHWGLYAIPAGEWEDNTNHAEWIRTTAQIPLEQYDKFVGQFNPVKFNADDWVRMARDAGMKYIVITTKHHDGFSLFNSKYTDYDIMATPFQRDIMDELANSCRKYGLRICWYHSIMDWHHPDYLPRRSWEKGRGIEGANFERYIAYMKNQLKELVENYGDIGVLWFDGEWEETWTHEYGLDLYEYVRSLQPNIIINNRVDIGRSGMQGLTRDGGYVGDFGTPEQEIPPIGLPGVDWETCMTMNDHWGYNKNNHNWKSATDLIQKLADIVSKGGNFLLNVGPTAEGLFPQPSIDRLAAIGRWMKLNGEAIHGTIASPFTDLSWGRCTQKIIDGGTRLYLHVFIWPGDGRLVVPGIYSNPDRAYILSDREHELGITREEDSIVVQVPDVAPDSMNSVIVLEFKGRPDVNNPPKITTQHDIFIYNTNVSITSERENIIIHYTLDGSEPTIKSPTVTGAIRLTNSARVSARSFRDGQPVSRFVHADYKKVNPRPALTKIKKMPGVRYNYFEGSWDSLPDFQSIDIKSKGIVPNFDISIREQNDYFGFMFEGLIYIQEEGIYSFYTDSDDGSRFYIGDRLVVENDGLHGMSEAAGSIALSMGYHPFRVTYFEKGGGNQLIVSYEGPDIAKQAIPAAVLFYQK